MKSVNRTLDDIGYDEYDAKIIRAKTPGFEPRDFDCVIDGGV